MLIVFDTNIFVTDFWMKSLSFKDVLLPGLRKLHLEPCVPAIVVDEVVNKYAEWTQKKCESVASATNALNRHAGEEVHGPFDEQESKRLTDKFKTWFTAQLAEHAFEVLDYPKVSHEALARRDLTRRRPFQVKGTGYRDTLIWESVLELAASAELPIVFVSNNVADFANEARDGLHDHLLADLDQRAIPQDRVQLITSLDALNKTYVLPGLTQLGEVARLLAEGTYQAFNLRDWLGANFDDLVSGEDVGFVAYDLPQDCGTQYATLKRIETVDVLDVRELPSGDILLIAAAHVVVTASASLSCEDYDVYPEAREFFGPDDFSDIDMTSDEEIRFRFLLIIDGSGEVSDYELTEVAGEYQSFTVDSTLDRPHRRRRQR